MKPMQTLVRCAVLAVAAAAAVQQAQAQCAPARSFASAINGTTKQGFGQVGVSSASVTPLGDEIGRFWQSNDSTLGNNFGGFCPAAAFWKAPAIPAGTHALSGLIGGTDCFANTCPSVAENLTVVVEDWSSPAPGINGDAYLAVWQVSATPNLLRTWDFARTGTKAGAAATVFPHVPFPRVSITGMQRNGMNTEITINIGDVAANFHGAEGGPTTAGSLGNPLPATSTIASYDVLYHDGDIEPGRLRSSWDLVKATVPYDGTAITGLFLSVPCDASGLWGKHAHVAVGINFEGGAGPDVPSVLVGRAEGVFCGLVLAEPEQQLARPPRKQSVAPRPPGRR